MSGKFLGQRLAIPQTCGVTPRNLRCTGGPFFSSKNPFTCVLIKCAPTAPPDGTPPTAPPDGTPPTAPPDGTPPTAPPLRHPPYGTPPTAPPLRHPPYGTYTPPTAPPRRYSRFFRWGRRKGEKGGGARNGKNADPLSPLGVALRLNN